MSLDSFQRRVLEEFFERQSRFFLTGGGALAGFHLEHRRTKDLDLFTVEDALDQTRLVERQQTPGPFFTVR